MEKNTMPREFGMRSWTLVLLDGPFLLGIGQAAYGNSRNDFLMLSPTLGGLQYKECL